MGLPLNALGAKPRIIFFPPRLRPSDSFFYKKSRRDASLSFQERNASGGLGGNKSTIYAYPRLFFFFIYNKKN